MRKTISVPKAGKYHPEDQSEILAAFQSAPSLLMGQEWNENLEERFRPATVKVLWQEDELRVLAELDDEILFTRATENNQHIYLLGDVLELFLRDLCGEKYAELHVAPNGKQLQLVFPNASQIVEIRARRASITELFVPEPLFSFTQWENPGKWFVHARVPVAAFTGGKDSLLGREWLASFSRYDYSSTEEKPVCSSTSPHKISNFHDQEAWALLRFVE